MTNSIKNWKNTIHGNKLAAIQPPTGMEEQSLDSYITGTARIYPDKIAIQNEDQSISYGELEKKSNCIANFMYGKIKKIPHVSIILDRSPALIESIIGLLKCGLIFVPLNPSFPAKRVKQMTEESQAQWVITSVKYYKKFKDIIMPHRGKSNLKILLIDGNNREFNSSDNIFCLEPGLDHENLTFTRVFNQNCYIYFTSGSTGPPKGVLGRQRSLVHFIQWEIKEFKVNQHFKVSQMTPPSFDPFLRDIFLPLMVGGTCCIPSRDTLMDMEKLVHWIEKNNITLIHTVPALFKSLVPVIEDADCLHQLKYILLAGELLRGRDIYKFTKIFKDRIQLVNIYGPTETTLAKLFHRVKPGDANRAIIPVGKPIDGARVLILDSKKRKCRPGIKGEIYIRTPFISSGYYNDPQLNEKVFIKNPYGKHPGDIIYKTGDLGRLLPDGNIELSGRVDLQVKIRGVRIELGEIENQLLKHNKVKEAVAAAREDETGDKYICVYIIAKNPELSPKELRAFLAKALPDNMIPSYFVFLEKIPLTANGKVHRPSLPAPVIDTGKSYTAPGNQTEKKLVHIWADVLGLGQDKIGIDTNFIELGGNSLKAIVLISKIHKKLQLKLTLNEVFKGCTIRDLARSISTPAVEEDIPTAIENPAEKKEFYELSYHQGRLWVMSQLEPGSSFYNLSRRVTPGRSLDEHILKKVLYKMLERHQSLRTGIKIIHDKPVQFVAAASGIEIPFKTINLTAADTGQKNQTIETLFNRELEKTFDLSKPPLLRVLLIKTDNEQDEAIFTIHHIITDGRSMEILAKEFFLLYDAFGNGKEMEPEPRNLQYKDFSEWQHRQLRNNESLNESYRYWHETLRNGLPPLKLPVDHAKNMENPQGAGYCCTLSKEIKDKLKGLARTNNTTLFTVLFSGFALLLSRLLNLEDIVCWLISSGRENSGMYNAVGFFVHSLPVKIHIDKNEMFTGLLGRVNQAVQQTLLHQDYPLERVCDEINMRYPEIAAAFNMLNMRDTAGTIFQGSLNSFHVTRQRNVNFQIEPYAAEYENCLYFYWAYRRKLFQPETIEYIANQYLQVLEAAAQAPQNKVNRYRLFIPGVPGIKKTLIQPPHDFPGFPRGDIHQSIVSRFREVVRQSPDSIAIKTGNHAISYGALHRLSNQIARAITHHTGKTAKGAALLFEHDREMIAGMLGVLKAGLFYIPLDPTYPKKRLEYMIKDSDARVILTNHANLSLAETLIDETDNQIKSINIDTIDQAVSKKNLPIEINPDNLAYILYTSGSTGVPKGVVQTHGNVLHFIQVYTNRLFIRPDDGLTLFSSYSFDAAVMDIYGALLNGATLYPFDVKKEDNLMRLTDWLKDEPITIYHSIPTLYRYFTGILASNERFPNIRLVVLGGEAVYKKDVETLKRYFPGDSLFINGLGPTESTVTLQYFINRRTLISKDAVPVGFPVEHTRVSLLDQNNKEAPVLGEGELVFKSDYLALGYLNQPGKTHDVFTIDPLTGKGRVYRTGDMGKYLPDGSIQYTGRKDHQVKINGYRVELEEIENLLDKQEEIRKSVVVCQQNNNGDNYLTAFYVKQEEVNERILAGILNQSLPPYMVPRYFVPLDDIPLTPSGKLDRKVLQDYKSIRQQAQGSIIAPTTALEKIIATTVAEIFHLDNVSIHDNFFDLGINSLDMIRFNAQLKRVMARDIPVITLFRYSTIASLAEVLGKTTGENIDEEFSCNYRADILLKSKKGKQQRLQLRKRKQYE